MAIQQIGLFSHIKLNGYYRYGNVFQILPLDVTKDTLLIDFPLILEVNYCPKVFIGEQSPLWYRDVWEEERLRSIENKSGKKVDFSETWGKAFELQTKSLRKIAIGEEVANLLTLFTNHRLFSYDSKQYWFLSIDETNKEFKQHWGQIGYLFPTKAQDQNLSDVASYTDVNRIPVDEYNKKMRDAFYVGSENEISFPADIDKLLDIYFGLSDENKKIFYIACKLYNQALELKSTHPSFSLVASVTAVEALIKDSSEKGCTECGAKPSIEQCASCGLPRHQISSRFKQFFIEYGEDSESMNRFARDFYTFRSSIAHGGLLREDLNDSGFH
jgi:hypothetical protein